MGFTCSGKEVGNEWKRISILFGYSIEASKIYTEVEGFIFLEGKDYQSTMGGGRSTLPSPTDSTWIQAESGWNGRNGWNLVGMSCQ